MILLQEVSCPPARLSSFESEWQLSRSQFAYTPPIQPMSAPASPLCHLTTTLQHRQVKWG